ncbi:MAG: metallophosphoesterase family protein [Candidatus Daviesbacteria bacterium]|nr:metallophosphoesterase family protein [Candidatus Daviesbacteria bacterium]
MFNRHHQGRRHTNIVFVIFRLILSVFMFVVLLIGIYSAYKHFSGLDPLKLDPVSVLNNVITARTPKQFLNALPSFKVFPKTPESVTPPQSVTVRFKFLLLADSHTDNVNLAKAIEQAKSAYPDLKFIIGLGDYSDVGTIAQLKNAKTVFDASGLRYFLVPGDHDLWDCRNRGISAISCFNEVFGPSYQSFEFDNFKFLLLDNSDDYLGLTEAENGWIDGELEKVKQGSFKGVLVFLHEPLFHPSSDRIMGKIEASLKQQAKSLMFQLKDAKVKQVFAGDIHFFSQYSEPVTGLSMVTIGAVTIERNPQAPRFAIMSVLEDGSIKAEDVIILGI